MLIMEELLIEPEARKRPGGQHVGAGPVGVWVTHLPTGLKVFCNKERSQHCNRAIAMEMIEWGLSSTGR